MAKRKITYRRAGRWALYVLALAALATLALLGWRWQASVELDQLDIDGQRLAERDTLAALARVTPGEELFAIDPDFVADRVRRHPWVRSVRVMRLPTGTLRIRVTEREPVALALDARGAPERYLDATGHQMPLVEGAAFDVPLLRGVEAPYHPLRPVEEAPVRALLQTLAESEDAALLSELDIGEDGHVTGFTLPGDPHGAVPVRLGERGFEEKLKRLAAFWEKAVRTQPNKTFEYIDLRFEGQVVTREFARRETS